MAHLGNTIVNGALRVLGGEYVDTINGVTVGDSPKFTDHTYTAATAAPGNIASSSAQGSSANYARQDHTHGISLATGDSNGQVKIAGTNVSVKGLGTAAYTASTAYATSGHTHTLSIAADSGTSSLTMAANTKYKITAGGSSYIFTTPPDNNTNNAVTQTATTTSADYEVLFSVTADNTTRTEGARKNSNLKFNPSTGNLQATQLNGVAIGSSPKFTDTTYSAGSNITLTGTTFSLTKANVTGALGYTPPTSDTNNAVTQTATTTSADYEVLFSATADNTTRTEGSRKNSNLKFNPSTGNLTVTKVNGETVKYTSSVNAVVGDTTCTISDSSIATTSLIEPFSSNSTGDTIAIKNIAVTAGQAVLTFKALSVDTSFRLRVTNV